MLEALVADALGVADVAAVAHVQPAPVELADAAGVVVPGELGADGQLVGRVRVGAGGLDLGDDLGDARAGTRRRPSRCRPCTARRTRAPRAGWGRPARGAGRTGASLARLATNGQLLAAMSMVSPGGRVRGGARFRCCPGIRPIGERLESSFAQRRCIQRRTQRIGSADRLLDVSATRRPADAAVDVQRPGLGRLDAESGRSRSRGSCSVPSGSVSSGNVQERVLEQLASHSCGSGSSEDRYSTSPSSSSSAKSIERTPERWLSSSPSWAVTVVVNSVSSRPDLAALARSGALDRGRAAVDAQAPDAASRRCRRRRSR